MSDQPLIGKDVKLEILNEDGTDKFPLLRREDVELGLHDYEEIFGFDPAAPGKDETVLIEMVRDEAEVTLYGVLKSFGDGLAFHVDGGGRVQIRFACPTCHRMIRFHRRKFPHRCRTCGDRLHGARWLLRPGPAREKEF